LNRANVPIWQKMGEGGDWSILPKSGHTLEKDSQPKNLVFSSNKNVFVKLITKHKNFFIN
jgi:hypothetical protein